MTLLPRHLSQRLLYPQGRFSGCVSVPMGLLRNLCVPKTLSELMP